jgi:hypothetical protein
MLRATSQAPIVRMRHPDAPRFHQRGRDIARIIEEHLKPDYWSKRDSQVIVLAIIEINFVANF